MHIATASVSLGIMVRAHAHALMLSTCGGSASLAYPDLMTRRLVLYVAATAVS